MSVYILCMALFMTGLYCVLRKRNIIKIIIGICIMEYAVNMLFVLIGYRVKGRSPIRFDNQTIVNMVDPLPQAIVVATIVIGLSVILLLIAMAIKIYEKYGTFDITKINKLKG